MKKEANYFPHFYNARNDDKILKLRTRFNNCYGYGLFFMLAEILSESTTGHIYREDIAELSLSLSIDIKELECFVDKCIEIGILFEDKIGITSKTTKDFKKFRNERSISGLKGSDKRWGKNNSSANSSAIKQLIAIKEKKLKEKKLKEKKLKETKIIIDISLFPFFANTEFSLVFKNYLEMRNKLKKPASEEAKRLVLLTLHKYPIEIAIQMLNKSIISSWTDVYPLKDKEINHKSWEGNGWGGEAEKL